VGPIAPDRGGPGPAPARGVVMSEIGRVAVVGAGSWGTTFAALLAPGGEVVLWAREPDLADQLDTVHENARYLPGIALPATLHATSDLAACCTAADAVVVGVPSHGLRAVVTAAAPSIPPDTPIISLSKGVEQDTHLRMTEVITDVLSGHRADRIGVLTGPNLAREVAEGQPTASVVAMADPDATVALQRRFMTATFRVYTNPDVVGCEIAGALKNVVAIAAGIAAGLGYGDNTKAALITRGLAELARLGVALGGDPLTFSGLAGMGDLVATCTSPKSRNRTVGVELGRGRSLDEITSEMNMVAEGVKSTAAVLALAADHHVDMPIAAMVGAVLYDGRLPADLVPALMVREAKSELHGIR
jgi:glycerol-3-phosphate dehydrogenase (NAD(P)+)